MEDSGANEQPQRPYDKVLREAQHAGYLWPSDGETFEDEGRLQDREETIRSLLELTAQLETEIHTNRDLYDDMDAVREKITQLTDKIAKLQAKLTKWERKMKAMEMRMNMAPELMKARLEGMAHHIRNLLEADAEAKRHDKDEAWLSPQERSLLERTEEMLRDGDIPRDLEKTMKDLEEVLVAATALHELIPEDEGELAYNVGELSGESGWAVFEQREAEKNKPKEPATAAEEVDHTPPVLTNEDVHKIWEENKHYKPAPLDTTAERERRGEEKLREMCVHIRWMIRRDMPEVLEIEKEAFEFPWQEEDFIRCLRQRNCIGMVAEYDEKVVGFMIYELYKDKMRILNFATKQSAQRRTVGTQMVKKLISKLSHQRRNKIDLEIRETNVPAQVFFGEQGFLAHDVLRDFYDDTVEDAYAMRYLYDPNGLDRKALLPKNRITSSGA